MCRSVFTIVQLNRYSSWKCLQWLYKQGVRYIQDIWSAFWQQFKYRVKRGLAFYHTGKSVFCYHTVLQGNSTCHSLNIFVWVREMAWPGWFCDKHLMWLQCIIREFHSLKKTFLNIPPFPSTIIHFLPLEAWAWTEWSHLHSIMNSHNKR